jgi:hypothetical protein
MKLHIYDKHWGKPMRNQPTYNRRSMLGAATSAFALFATGLARSAFGQSMSPLVKSAVDAYIYFYPLVVFGVSFEVLTNVEKPTWERLSAPLNQFMSVRQNRPDNHGVILPSTDTCIRWLGSMFPKNLSFLARRKSRTFLAPVGNGL